MTINEDLTRITGMTESERRDCLRWLSRQAESFQINLMYHRFKIFHSLKTRYAHENPSLIELAALHIAAKGQGWLATRKMKTKRPPTNNELKLIATRRQERTEINRNPAKKREKLARIWGVVIELRASGHSYHAIAKYLSKAHRIKVTRQYLYQLYKKWELK